MVIAGYFFAHFDTDDLIIVLCKVDRSHQELTNSATKERLRWTVAPISPIRRNQRQEDALQHLESQAVVRFRAAVKFNQKAGFKIYDTGTSSFPPSARSHMKIKWLRMGKSAS